MEKTTVGKKHNPKTENTVDIKDTKLFAVKTVQ